MGGVQQFAELPQGCVCAVASSRVQQYWRGRRGYGAGPPSAASASIVLFRVWSTAPRTRLPLHTADNVSSDHTDTCQGGGIASSITADHAAKRLRIREAFICTTGARSGAAGGPLLLRCACGPRDTRLRELRSSCQARVSMGDEAHASHVGAQ